jgi:hypothetical protein
MSNIPADLQALADGAPIGNLMGALSIYLPLAVSGNPRISETLAFILDETASLPEEIPADKKRLTQLCRALFMRMTSEEKTLVRGIRASHPGLLVGGKRGARKSRKSRGRKGRKQTRRRRN